MIRSCPQCWNEIPANADHCPHCGRLTDETGLPFVERLLLTLGHPEPTRSGLAIDVLAGRLREPRAVLPLIDLLITAQDIAIQQQAARGLGLLADRRAVPPLIRLLESEAAPLVTRREAALALARLGGVEAGRALERARIDPRPSVAEAARRALDLWRAGQ